MFTDTGNNISRDLQDNPRPRQQEDNSAPMMAVFGGMFALMLVFLVVINAVSEAAVRERLKDSADDGSYRIQREDGGFGYSIIVFPEAIRIVETAQGIGRGAICDQGSAFREYAERIYRDSNDQLLFFILEESVSTMAEARNCIRELMWPEQVSIGWVIADNEFLKSVMLDDIPEYIKEHAETTP